MQIVARQLQTSGTIFRYPLEVQVNMSGGQTVTETVWIEAESQVVSFFVPARPISVTMDPANKMLDENFLDATTGIDPVLPARLAAWPNPFRGRLSMAGAAPRARIDVFDLAGRRVRELTAGAAGDLVWDARDAAGLRLAPGAYFLRVEGSRRALRVMLLPGGD